MEIPKLTIDYGTSKLAGVSRRGHLLICSNHAHCVMHTHTAAGLAVACTKGRLSMTNFHAAQLHGKVAYHNFEGITTNPEEDPCMLNSMDGTPDPHSAKSWICWCGVRQRRRLWHC